MNIYDIAIVGAGPAGCLAAIGAKQVDPNLRIAIIEKESQPKHKVGEALLTGTIMTFEDAGILDEITSQNYHTKIGAAYLWGEKRDNPWYVNYPVDIKYPEAFIKNIEGKETRTAIHVERREFERHLRSVVESKGVEFIYDKVKGIESYNSDNIRHLDLSENGRIKAKYYLDCSGQAALFAKNLNKRHKIGESRVATYGYFSINDWEGIVANGYHPNRTNILSSKNGWMWVIPLGVGDNDLVSVGFVTLKDIAKQLTTKNFTEFFPEAKIFGLHELKAKDIDGNEAEKFYYHPDYSHINESIHGNNWACAGDAAAFIDPILSQGVTLASHYGLMRGRAAASAIHGDNNHQKSVSDHYYNEVNILLEVCTEWYSKNSSIEDWKMKSVFISEKSHDRQLNTEDGFRWITNLENLYHDYNPFDSDTLRHIKDNLGRNNK